jgi:hypothetical protein
MKIFRLFKSLLIPCLIFFAISVTAQTKGSRPGHGLRKFTKNAAMAGITFSMPEGFKELNDKSEANPFDFGMCLPGQGFEVWFKVMPKKANTPDSLYLAMGRNEAKELCRDDSYLVRGLPDEVLEDYNADVGKTYFLNLPDSPVTKHYKYALLITLQKNDKGIVMAAGFTNDKGPEFFKNLNRARNCIRFKSAAP